MTECTITCTGFLNSNGKLLAAGDWLNIVSPDGEQTMVQIKRIDFLNGKFGPETHMTVMEEPDEEAEAASD
jgi:hypothetical protein